MAKEKLNTCKICSSYFTFMLPLCKGKAMLLQLVSVPPLTAATHYQPAVSLHEWPPDLHRVAKRLLAPPSLPPAAIFGAHTFISHILGVLPSLTQAHTYTHYILSVIPNRPILKVFPCKIALCRVLAKLISTSPKKEGKK